MLSLFFLYMVLINFDVRRLHIKPLPLFLVICILENQAVHTLELDYENGKR